MECCSDRRLGNPAPKGPKDSAQGFNPVFNGRRRSALKAAVQGLDFAHGLEDQKCDRTRRFWCLQGTFS
jgi:hypothetical protein